MCRRMYCISSIALCVASWSCAIFEHDRGVYAGQQQSWPVSVEWMKKAVANNPHDPSVLYDAGVASYRVGEYAPAQAYFEQAAALATTMPEMQERAFFNVGNAYAHTARYQDAVDAYQKALELNPENKQAQENLALIQKLLEQKNQEQKNDQDNANDKEDSDQQHDQGKGDDRDTSGQEKSDQENGDNGDSPADRGNEQSHSDQQPSNEKGQQGDQASKNAPQANKNKSSPQHDQSDKSKKEKSKNAQKPEQAASGGKENKSAVAAGGTPDATAPAQPVAVSAYLDQILSDREQQDAALQKALMRMQAAQQQGAGDEQAQW